MRKTASLGPFRGVGNFFERGVTIHSPLLT